MRNKFPAYIFLFLLISGSLIAEDNQPKITFSELEHHFGNIVQGAKAVHSFFFKNEGKAPLKIDRVQTSCGCTAAVVGKQLLEPQESSEIQVTFNSAGRSGDFKKTIQVFSNDPLTPRIELKIDGAIQPQVMIQPQFINLGTFRVGQPMEKELQIKLGAYPKPLKIAKTENSSRLEVIQDDQPITLENAKILKVKVLPSSKVGSFNEKITFIFEDSAVNPVSVRVYGKLEGVVRIVPDRIYFMLKADTTFPVAQKIQFSRTDEKTFKITHAEIDPDLFAVQIVPKEDQKGYEVVLELKSRTQERFFSRILKISTDEETMRTIEIPVQVWIVNSSKV